MSYGLSKTVKLTILILYKSYFVKLRVTFITISDYCHLKWIDFMVEKINNVNLYRFIFEMKEQNLHLPYVNIYLNIKRPESYFI